MSGGYAGREPYEKTATRGGGRLAEQHGQHFDDRGGTREAGGDQPEHGDEGGHGQAERATGQLGENTIEVELKSGQQSKAIYERMTKLEETVEKKEDEMLAHLEKHIADRLEATRKDLEEDSAKRGGG